MGKEGINHLIDSPNNYLLIQFFRYKIFSGEYMQYTINYYTDFIKKLKDKEEIIFFAIF